MARIPDEVPLNGQRTAVARPAPIDTGDLGLGRLAANLQQIAEGQRQTAQVQATAALASVRGTFDTGFKTAAETYDGFEPGFAQQQVDAWDSHVNEARQGLSEDAALAFDAANLQERLRVIDQAGSIEAKASGDIIRRQRAQEIAARVTDVSTHFWAETENAKEAAFVSGDPAGPDFLKNQTAAFDERMKAALDAARPEDRIALQGQLTNQRGDFVMSLSTTGRKLLAARVIESTRSSVGALVNQVTANPVYLDQAIKRAPNLLAGLPADLRQTMAASLPGDLAAAALTGLREREDYHGLQAKLDDPRFKKLLPPEAFARFSQIAQTALNSEQRAMAAVTVGERLDAELASLRDTGQSTGFDPAALIQVYGPAEGPARVAQAQQAIADAKTVYQAVGDAAGLTTKDLNARLDLLKPVAGDPDYARKKKRYDQAAEVAQGLMALRQTDPALAVQADRSSQALWRAAGDGTPATAQAWANDALRRQAALGVPDAQQAVLPVGEAKRLVRSVAVSDPVSKAAAMGQVFAYAQRFGGHAGRVLMELQRAGLPPAESAVINAVDGDEVVVSAYANALTKAPQVKVDKADKAKLDDAVAEAMQPLVESYGGSRDGLAYANALTFAVATMARANMGDDQSAKDAARAAAKHFVGRYTFDDKTGNRIPRVEAARQVVFVPGTTSENQFNMDELTGPARMNVKPRAGDAGLAIRVGTFRALRDLVADGGKALAPVAAAGSPLDQAQRRARYADQVAHDGRWVTSPDDSGQQLVLRDPRGGFLPVFGADGKPIVRSWSEIYARAGKP